MMMDAFFAPAIPAEAVLSPKLRVHIVDGDGMEPTLRSRKDYVLLAPVTEWCGDGLYLVDWGAGPTLYREQHAGLGKVLIKLDNPLYRDEGNVFTRDQFNDMVVGYVVADIQVREERFLRAAA